MIALIICGSYAAIWLLTARWLYGRWRGHQVGRRDCGRHGTEEARKLRYPPVKACCYDETTSSNGETSAVAMTAALLWPMVWLTALVRLKPPPTAAERAAKEAEYKARVAELEHELGIGDQP